jgi:FtsZ-binding cell division protein ZapB
MEERDAQVRHLADQVSTLKLQLKEEKSQTQMLSQKVIESSHRIAELESQSSRLKTRVRIFRRDNLMNCIWLLISSSW